jgi:hypothetical protein
MPTEYDYLKILLEIKSAGARSEALLVGLSERVEKTEKAVAELERRADKNAIQHAWMAGAAALAGGIMATVTPILTRYLP